MTRTPRGRSAGSRSSRRSTPSSRWPRTCGCSRGWRSCADPEHGGDADARARPVSRTAPTRRSGGSRAATSSGSTSRSGCCPSPPCCCSTSPRPRSTRASASGCGSSSAAWPQRGTTVVFSTHNVAEAERYAERVLVLGRRRAAVHRHAGRARAGGGRRAARLRGRVRPLPARPRPLRRTRALAARSRTCRSSSARRCSSRCWSSTRSRSR